MTLPLLYSFRRCPFAIRARLALRYAGIAVEHREVLLRDKPAQMLAASPKGTVPVLVLPEAGVLDESIDIMTWALSQADPGHWQSPPCVGALDEWIAANDGPFKSSLDRYKYADRHPEHPAAHYRDEACAYLRSMDAVLAEHDWLHGHHQGFADAALFPFIRQFAMVDYAWFEGGPYPNLCRWLETWLAHPLFLAVMEKVPPWRPDENAGSANR